MEQEFHLACLAKTDLITLNLRRPIITNLIDILLIGNQAGMQDLSLLTEGGGAVKVSDISAGSLSSGVADWLEPCYPVIEFVMRTPAQLYSPSRP